MKFHLSDAEVQRIGIIAIGTFCERETIANTLGRQDGIAFLMQVWRLHFNDKELVSVLLENFQLFLNDEPNRQMFAEHLGMQTLVQSLSQYGVFRNIPKIGCKLVSTLCFSCPGRAKALVREGGVKILIGFLNDATVYKDSRLETEVCRALKYICMEQFCAKQFLELEDSLEKVCHIFGNASDPAVAEMAMTVVRTLFGHSVNSEVLTQRDSPVLTELLSFMDLTIFDLPEYEICYETAFNLLNVFIVKRGGRISKGVLIRILENYISLAKDFMEMKRAMSTKLLGSVCQCMRQLVTYDDGREVILGIPESVEVLVNCVAYLSQMPSIVGDALLVLAHIVCETSEAKARVRRADGISIINSAIKANILSASACEGGLAAVTAVCTSNARNCSVARRQLLPSLCLRCVKDFEDNAIIQERGLRAILSIAVASERSGFFKESDVCQAARTAAQRHANSIPITTLATEIEAMCETASQSSRSPSQVNYPIRASSSKLSNFFRKMSFRRSGG